MNSITFKTTLLKGDTGAGIDKTIPEDGVIYYDGDSAPEGYEQTTDPTGGGGGGAYSEHTLWSGTEYATNTELSLNDDITNYNQICFQVYRAANNYPDQQISQIHLTNDLPLNTTITVLGYDNGDYLYMQVTAYNKIKIIAGYGASFTIRKIVGINY